MLYTLLRQFANIFLLAVPSVRDASMWLRLSGCAWIWYRFICIFLFDVEENVWPHCSCFRHATIANSQKPGRLELVGFFLDSGSDTKFQLISINEETRAPIRCPNCAFLFFLFGAIAPTGPGPPHSRGF